MAIGDLFRAKHKHSDPSVRADAVRALGDDEAELLADIAREDDDAGVRRLALERIRDADLLSRVATEVSDPATRAYAEERATEEFMSILLAGQGDVDGALVWLGSQADQSPLAVLAREAPTVELRRRSFERIRDQRALADVVRGAKETQVAAAALERIVAPEVLRSLAMDIEWRDLGAAVVDRIEDEAALSALASRAKSKAVRSRANKRLLAMRGEVATVHESEPQPEAEANETQPLSMEDLEFAPEPVPEPGSDPEPEPESEPEHDHERPATAPRNARPDKSDIQERNLAQLEQLSGDMERLVTAADVKLKTVEKKLHTADTSYPKLLVLPSGAKRKALDRFQEARRKLIIKVGELKEAEEWKRWANVPKQEQLIAQVAALVETPDAGALVPRLKDLQAAWKAVGPAPKDKAQDLWQRFKDQSDLVYERIKHRRSEQAVEHKENLEKKLALCARAEELSESTDWGHTADAFKRLQAEWKVIGPVDRKKADEVWKRFRTACDRFFERRRPHLEQAIGERQEAIDRKTALVERAEALAAGGDDADWDAAIREVGDLRREWKRAGQVPHREFEQLSRRIQEACDRVYTRRDEARTAAALKRRDEVLGPCTEADALLDAGGELDEAALAGHVVRARAALRELESAGGATADLRSRVAALIERALAAHPGAFKGTDLDPDQTRKRKEKLVAKVEELAAKASAAPAAPASAADMAARLRAALADRALGGVLAKETRPVGDQVLEVRDAWRRLGPVPGPAGEELERRFTEACRRAGVSN
ncbi:MAG TPA: DUF349 domain-containing protein [Kofleriaceae bacterium]|nr:DUF349 domain-containing protein [Kofleriaceae bacterium]